MAPAAPLIVLIALLPTLAAVTNAEEEHPWPPAPGLCEPFTPGHVCNDWQGSYAPGSAYEANLRLLAASTIPANKVNANSCNCSFVSNIAGDSPDRIVASAVCCWGPDPSSLDCDACVARAFREAQRLCPYHRMADVVVDGGACKLHFHDYDLMEEYVHAPIPATSSPCPATSYMCGGHGRYAPGSAYEASLHRLAAAVPFQANASSCNCSTGSVAGERPEMVSASAFCYWRSDASSADCAACIALAFTEAQRLCPYHRQAMVVVDRGACSVSFHDVQRAEGDTGVGGNTRQCPVDSDAPQVEFICHCLKELMARQMMLEKDQGKLENATEHPIQPLKLPQRITGI